MPRDVRNHTRTDPRTGRKVTVRHHTRRGRAGRKRGPNLQHAHKMGRRSVIHARRGRKGRAAMAAGVESRLWEIGDIVKVAEEFETAQ